MRPHGGLEKDKLRALYQGFLLMSRGKVRKRGDWIMNSKIRRNLIQEYTEIEKEKHY